MARHADATIVDLGDSLLAPGLVNAHAHLELSALDPVSDRSFRGWVDALIAIRRGTSPQDLEAGALAGANRMLETGTTLVGDIDSTGTGMAALRALPLRARVYREVLDAGEAARSGAALKSVADRLELPGWLAEGLSPHAPYTVSPELFRGLAELVRRRDCPIAVHWAETPEETEWMLHARGALGGLVQHSPRRSGLDLLDDAGLLGERTSLIHGNEATVEEIARIAAAGATCVHCPGSHAYFARPPFPLMAYRSAGVSIALGTDSAASNRDLDMRRELGLLRAAHPELSGEEAWGMATINGARALGIPGVTGALHVGSLADFGSYAAPSRAEGCFDALTQEGTALRGSWIGGKTVLGAVA